MHPTTHQEYKEKRLAAFREKFQSRPISATPPHTPLTLSSVESFLSQTIDECTAATEKKQRDMLREAGYFQAYNFLLDAVLTPKED